MAFNSDKRSDTQTDVIDDGSPSPDLSAFNQALLFKSAMIHLNAPRRFGLPFPLGLGHLPKARRPVFRRAVCGADAEYLNFAETYD